MKEQVNEKVVAPTICEGVLKNPLELSLRSLPQGIFVTFDQSPCGPPKVDFSNVAISFLFAIATNRISRMMTP